MIVSLVDLPDRDSSSLVVVGSVVRHDPITLFAAHWLAGREADQRQPES